MEHKNFELIYTSDEYFYAEFHVTIKNFKKYTHEKNIGCHRKTVCKKCG